MQHDLTNDEQRPLELLEQHSPRLDLWGHLSQIAKGTTLVATSIVGYMTFRRWFSREQQSTIADSVTLSEPNTSPVLSLRTAEIQKASEINVGASALRYRKRSVAAPQDQQNLSLNDSSPLSKSTEYNYRTAGEVLKINNRAGFSSKPIIVELDNNGFSVGWMDISFFYIRRFDAQDMAMTEPQVVTEHSYPFFKFSMIGLNANTTVLAYNEAETYFTTTGPKRFYPLKASIVVDEQPIKTIQISERYQNDNLDFDILRLDNNEFMVTWFNNTAGATTLQRYNSNGSSIGSSFIISTKFIARLCNNNLLGVNNEEFNLYAQLYTKEGLKLGSAFQLNDPGSSVMNLNNVPIAASPEEFIVYISQTFDTETAQIYLKRYNNNGTFISQGFSGSEMPEKIYYLKNGDYVGIPYIKIYKPNGELLSSLSLSRPASVASLNNGEFFVAWFTGDIYAQRYQLNHVPVLWRNQLNLHPGEKRRLTAQDLNATDAEGDPLIYRFSEIQHGRFEVLDAPGIAITSFNQTQLGAGQVQFVHDNSIYAPSYTVRVADNQLETENITAAITFNLQMNLVNNTLVIRQGKTVTLTLAQLQAQVNAEHYLDLQYIAANVQHGYFQLKTQPEQPILQFIHQQLHDGEIQFVHDGGNESPSYEISLSDGQTMTSPSRATVNFSLDKSPVIQHNILKLSPGEQIILGTQQINATDPEGDPLIYWLSGIQHGQFELIDTHGEAISSFNQTQLELGQVQFIHDNSIHAPSYRVKVDDGVLATDAIPAVIDFDLQMVLVKNVLAIRQGKKLTLTVLQLQAEVNTENYLDLQFRIANVQHGYFQLKEQVDQPILQFTQQQLDNSQVQFVHDGSNEAPTYVISLSNGQISTLPHNATIHYSLDAPPVMQCNALNLIPGEQVVLTTQRLNATSVNGDPLTYYVSGIQHGQFELINAPGEAISAFNQTQLESGQVQFIHDNSIHAPAYKVKVDDGFLATEAIPVITDFKLDLALVNNRITVMQGNTVTLSIEQIQARVNAAVNEDLLFIISNVAHGRFKIINFPNRDVTQFTQQQLSDGQVQFEHDGSNKAPAFSISLSNGVVTTTSSKVKVSFSLKPESSAEQQKGNNQKLKLGLGVGLPIATVGLFGAAVGTAAAIAACKRYQKKAKQYTMMQEEDITTHYYELDEASSHSVSFFQPAPVLLTSLEDSENPLDYDYRPS